MEDASAEATLLAELKHIIPQFGQLQDDTVESLQKAAMCFLKQMLADLTATQEQKQVQINSKMVFEALEARGLSDLSAEAQKIHQKRLTESKREKMQRLKDAGFGATYEHVNFMRAVFASHQSERQARKKRM